jgi:hypothetical protein
MDADGRLGVVKSGARYSFGFGASFYGIWDEHGAAPPMERFPATIEGKKAGWRRFVELEPSVPAQPPGVALEPTEGETRGPRRTPWIIAAAVVIVVGIVVAVVVLRSEKSATQAGGGGGGSNTAHVDVSGSITSNLVLPTKSVLISEGAVVPRADVTWQDAQGQALIFHITGVRTGDNVLIFTAGQSLELHVISNGTEVDFKASAGECTVSVQTLDAKSISGTYMCASLKNDAGDMTIDVKGSFSASS